MTASLKHVLRFWDKNKKPLFELFGNKFILEKNIDIKRPTAIMHEDMEDILYPSNGKQLQFVTEFMNWSYELAQKDWMKYDDLRRLLDIEVLCDNIYDYPSIEIPVPDNTHPLQIHKGCKAIKMLSKIAKTFNLNGFEEFRLAHSMVLNQKHFKGTLCLSIHPLDYMTMSDNYCDWDSCMSWKNGGEYRLGTVEMMNSPCVIVAYLKAEKDMQLFYDNEEVTWNNKRWRELFVVTPELITAIKGYPFNDDNLRSLIFEWLFDLAKNSSSSYFPVEYCPTELKIKNGTTVNVKGLDILINLKFHAMYNDYYSFHPGYFSSQIFKHGDGFQLLVSGETECMICGEDYTQNYSDLDTESLICPECSGLRRCPECGEYLYIDDFVDLEFGPCMCRWCADRYTSTCDGCNDLYHNNDLINVYLCHLDAVDLNSSICLCENCFNDSNIERSLGPIEYKRRNPWSVFAPKVYQVNSKNFDIDGFHMFGFYGDSLDEMLEDIAEYTGNSDD